VSQTVPLADNTPAAPTQNSGPEYRPRGVPVKLHDTRLDSENLFPTLNKILSLKLFSPERNEVERSVVTNPNLHHIDDIDLLFLVVTDPGLRTALLDKRYQIRLGNTGEAGRLP